MKYYRLLYRLHNSYHLMQMDLYGGIQSMLDNVKEVRKYNRDCMNDSKVRRSVTTTDEHQSK